MTKKKIKGLSEFYHKYDGFFIDLGGVVHNGIQLYPGAIKVLENLNKLNKSLFYCPMRQGLQKMWKNFY